MSLQTVIDIALAANYTKVSDLAAPSAAFSLKSRVQLTDGTTAGKADKIFADSRTISASSNDDIDLAGSLTDEFGQALTFAKVKVIAIRAKDTNTNDVKLGGASSNQFVGPFGAAAHTVATAPGGVTVLIAPKDGWSVTAATGDILRVANSGAGSAVVYDIVIIGTSA